jgi:hypothetical protein
VQRGGSARPLALEQPSGEVNAGVLQVFAEIAALRDLRLDPFAPDRIVGEMVMSNCARSLDKAAGRFCFRKMIFR